ncbi:divalent-cation tolerance protein CutA [Methylobacterium terricola]|uniref:Divalent-cation tolerance protein CutA n=1 Tax=Methylobacterium terricola TaxID=2583531 RepID=A0A5C4LFT2_9HYPH|nr:divalent-cation tolerance protein CutA [Methylobacterium terricola]TNC12456.1 divalent-cation tolerance protein CutA [Methylobacterium terricola]
MERPLLVYTTFPDAGTALAVGEVLAEPLVAALKSRHPYETVILTLPVEADPATLAWLVAETGGAPA